MGTICQKSSHAQGITWEESEEDNDDEVEEGWAFWEHWESWRSLVIRWLTQTWKCWRKKILCEIWGAHGSNYEDKCLLGSDNTVQSGRMLPMIWRNAIPQSPILKTEAGGASNMSIMIYKFTRNYIPDDSNPQEDFIQFIIYFCWLLHNASNIKTVNYRLAGWLMNWKGFGIIKPISHIFPKGLTITTKNISTASVLAKIRTQHLHNINPTCYL